MTRVLIVDDEPAVRAALDRALRLDGYEVELAADGREALDRLGDVRHDAVVLDVAMPGIDGLEVCRRLRSDPRTGRIPVVMLTARATEADRIVGLELGADDYITKPFSPRELVARLRAVLRRTSGPPEGSQVRQVGPVTLDLERRSVRAGDEAVSLTPTEFDLLAHLMNRPGRVYTREELLASVWGYAAHAGTRTVDVHVAQVRGKLGEHGGVIRTVRGVGYTADA